MNRLLFSLKTCQKSGGRFSEKQKRLRQRTHKFRAFRNMGGPFFWGKKGACGNVPTSSGLPEIWGPFFCKKKSPAAMYPQIKGFQIYGGHFPTPLTSKTHGSTKFHKKVKNLLELAKVEYRSLAARPCLLAPSASACCLCT